MNTDRMVTQGPVSASKVQLRMRRPSLANLPALAMPAGYTLRSYRTGDEGIWGTIMNHGLRPSADAEWTPALVRERLTGQQQFLVDGLFFAEPTPGGSPIGSACAWRMSADEHAVGYLHMVGVLPEHRGHALGYWLSLAVLHYFAEHGYQEVRLWTDDFRVSAILAYLALGFVPEHSHPSHAERWARVLAEVERRAPELARPAPGPLAILPIGVVHNAVTAPIHSGWEDIVSEIEVEPDFAEALNGVEKHGRLTVVFWLSGVTTEQRLIRKLRPRERPELPLTGVFATRSQYRPNPIGITEVDVLERRGAVVVVRGLDAIDRTPVLDLKTSPRTPPS